MAHDIETKRCKLLTLHYVVRSLAMSLASGFVGAYLLRLGFSLATAIAIYAVLYLTRFAIRFGAAAVIRGLGSGGRFWWERLSAACNSCPWCSRKGRRGWRSGC